MDDSDSNDSETTNLRKENEELKRELKASTLHLAALAHKEYQVPDGSIREDYQKLCRAIETWIDYASSEETGDFRNRFKEALKIEEKTHRLRDIGIEYQRPAALDPRLDWLRSLDMLHYFILSLVIGKYVFSEILRRQYPIGVTETQEAMLLSIEEEMSKMGKSKSKIRQWRSETLTALCASESYKVKEADRLSCIRNALEKDLSFWYENSGSKRSKDRLKSEILDPSVKIHLDMQCSTQRYEFIGERDMHSQPSSDKAQYSPDLVKEIMTWKTRASDGAEEVLQCIYPGVVVHDLETEAISKLVGPTMAVYKRSAHPQARRSTTSSSTKSSSRVDSPMKETRDSKHQKVSTSAPRGFSHVLNALIGGSSRKSGDDRQSPERTSPRRRRSPEPSSSRPSRRASRDTSSKQVQYTSSSYDQSMSYPQSSQPVQDWQAPVHASPSTYTRTLTANPYEEDEIIVEVDNEEMVYTSNHEHPGNYSYGRPSVQDGS